MARFMVRYRQQDIELPAGEFVVGRSRDCQLALEDPLISRRHAVFRLEGETLTVEDLGSRNGVLVNHKKADGRTAVHSGDVVTIGGQELTVILAPEKATARPLAVTMTGEPAADRSPLAILGGVVDKALAMGRVDEAERLLSNLLGDTLASLQAGKRDSSMLPEATRFALRLASETGKAQWIDWVFNAHLAASRVLPTATVDELYALVRKVRYPVTPAFKAYLAHLRSISDRLGPTDRFALQRIEGLMRVLLA